MTDRRIFAPIRNRCILKKADPIRICYDWLKRRSTTNGIICRTENYPACVNKAIFLPGIKRINGFPFTSNVRPAPIKVEYSFPLYS